MQRDVGDLKKLKLELLKSGDGSKVSEENSSLIDKIYSEKTSAEASILEEEQSQLSSNFEQDQRGPELGVEVL